MSKIIFVSSPYSHEDKNILEKRVEQVTKYVAKLVSEGHIVFSPIVYGHTLLQVQEMPSDYEFWKTFCLAFLVKSDEIQVLKLDGWENSKGVKDELMYAKIWGIPLEEIII